METPKVKKPKGCLIFLCSLVALIVFGCICVAKFGIPGEDKGLTTPQQMEFSLSQYDSTETEIEVGKKFIISSYMVVELSF